MSKIFFFFFTITSSIIFSNEEEAVKLDLEAIQLEKKSNLESNKWDQKDFLDTARLNRMKAEEIRQNLYTKNLHIKNTITKEDRINKFPFFYTGKFYSEFFFGFGNALYNSDRGYSYAYPDNYWYGILKNSTGFSRDSFLSYDNMNSGLNTNNQQTVNFSKILPIGYRFINSKRNWGFEVMNRSINVDSNYNEYAILTKKPNSIANFDGNFNLTDIKSNLIINEEINNFFCFFFLFGVRAINSDYQRKRFDLSSNNEIGFEKTREKLLNLIPQYGFRGNFRPLYRIQASAGLEFFEGNIYATDSYSRNGSFTKSNQIHYFQVISNDFIHKKSGFEFFSEMKIMLFEKNFLNLNYIQIQYDISNNVKNSVLTISTDQESNVAFFNESIINTLIYNFEKNSGDFSRNNVLKIFTIGYSYVF